MEVITQWYSICSTLTSPSSIVSSTQYANQQPNLIQNGQQLFAKATIIKPKTAAEVAAKALPMVSHFQQQILSPVSTIASETSQSQGRYRSLSPNPQSILMTPQDGSGGKIDVLFNSQMQF